MSRRVRAHLTSSREDLREIVQSGWNRVSFRYRPRSRSVDSFGHTERGYRTWLAPLLVSLPGAAKVLDLGSGTGIPTARILGARFRVTGVDLSDVQVRRARRLVPRARFIRGVLVDVTFPDQTFAAVTALYSLVHVPRTKHRAVFRKVGSWLGPGGWFLAILGHTAYEGRVKGWLGSRAPEYSSHYDTATYRRMLRSEGFRITHEEVVPEGEGGHQLFLARHGGPGSRTPSSGRARSEPSGRRAHGLPRRTPTRRPGAGLRRPPSRSG